jgi:hypothetical protein
VSKVCEDISVVFDSNIMILFAMCEIMGWRGSLPGSIDVQDKWDMIDASLPADMQQ